MSVAPDLLLKSAPATKPRTPAAKAQATPAEPRKNEASSFAQVYAKERQASSAERSDAAAKAGREPKSKQPDADEAPAVAAAEQPAFADSGKPLPSDPAAEPTVDALLLNGMAGQSAAQAESVESELGGEGELSVPSSTSLIGSGPASMTEASYDPELDALNQLPAVRMALELGAKAKAAAAEQNAAAGAVTQAGVAGGQGFASAMAAMAAQQAPDEVGEAFDVPLLELTAEGLEALKESSADNRPENFVSRLSALSQAVGQHAALTPRAGLVPGQPVAMQQGGWSEAVVDRVMWLSSQNLKSAEIQLDPAELGRLEVRINMNQEQTQVTFASPNAGVREALEGQMHRLRELFTQQGMNQLDVSVSDQSLNRGWQGQEGDGKGRGGSAGEPLAGVGEDAAQGAVEVTSGPLGSARGLVDYYA
ncbi:flagellar hook-length control protein FliK [Pseudomonas sp. CrR25]|nr:flagellar hook-length control protein FliK [Pseudomonas sp. CrR25]